MNSREGIASNFINGSRLRERKVWETKDRSGTQNEFLKIPQYFPLTVVNFGDNLCRMDEVEKIRPIGESLVDFSRHARSSARGLITLMFPYIYPASKRMSTRAISAYLEQVHQVNISAATIAKALREPEKHVSYLAESIEPAARVVAEGLGVDVRELLDNENLFIANTETPPILGGTPEWKIVDAHQRYVNARRHLERCWYPLDGSVQAMVISMIEGSNGEVGDVLPEDASNE